MRFVRSCFKAIDINCGCSDLIDMTNEKYNIKIILIVIIIIIIIIIIMN